MFSSNKNFTKRYPQVIMHTYTYISASIAAIERELWITLIRSNEDLASDKWTMWRWAPSAGPPVLVPFVTVKSSLIAASSLWSKGKSGEGDEIHINRPNQRRKDSHPQIQLRIRFILFSVQLDKCKMTHICHFYLVQHSSLLNNFKSTAIPRI